MAKTVAYKYGVKAASKYNKRREPKNIKATKSPEPIRPLITPCLCSRMNTLSGPPVKAYTLKIKHCLNIKEIRIIRRTRVPQILTGKKMGIAYHGINISTDLVFSQ